MDYVTHKFFLVVTALICFANIGVCAKPPETIYTVCTPADYVSYRNILDFASGGSHIFRPGTEEAYSVSTGDVELVEQYVSNALVYDSAKGIPYKEYIALASAGGDIVVSYSGPSEAEAPLEMYRRTARGLMRLPQSIRVRCDNGYSEYVPIGLLGCDLELKLWAAPSVPLENADILVSMVTRYLSDPELRSDVVEMLARAKIENLWRQRLIAKLRVSKNRLRASLVNLTSSEAEATSRYSGLRLVSLVRTGENLECSIKLPMSDERVWVTNGKERRGILVANVVEDANEGTAEIVYMQNRIKTSIAYSSWLDNRVSMSLYRRYLKEASLLPASEFGFSNTRQSLINRIKTEVESLMEVEGLIMHADQDTLFTGTQEGLSDKSQKILNSALVADEIRVFRRLVDLSNLVTHSQ